MKPPCDRPSTVKDPKDFPSTHRSLLLRVLTENPDRRRQAQGKICTRYWMPVCAFLIRRGNSRERAEDLTQGFFADMLLSNKLMRALDFHKLKRFRSFLVKAVDTYARQTHRSETAAKRKPKNQVSLESYNGSELLTHRASMEPAQVFDFVWAQCLVRSALENVKRGLIAAGKQADWKAFDSRVVRPLLDNAIPTPISELRTLWEGASATAVSLRILRVKEHLAQHIRAAVGTYVDTDNEIEQEIRDLMEILSTGSVRS